MLGVMVCSFLPKLKNTGNAALWQILFLWLAELLTKSE
jgi:hypothetical protein